MREIKFRAWFSKQQKMVNVEEMEIYNGGVTVKAKTDWEKGGWYTQLRGATNRKTVALGSTRQVPRVILMQYIGVKDKNGVDVYDGDIVQVKADDYELVISEVKWGEVEYPAFDLPKYDGYGMNAFAAIYHSDPKETIEVIGNIYENPDLIS